MSPTLHERLAERSVAGRYDMFLAIGAGLAILGLILFIRALLSSPALADRAWHLFHVNWIYFTGLSAGGVAFAAVQKITNAKWSGMIIRFAEALVAFLPVSLVGLILIFTAGYDSIYGPMQGALHEMQHSKAVWLSHDFMFARLGLGLLALTILGWRLVWADMKPDMYAFQRTAAEGRRLRYERWSGAYDATSATAAAQERRIHRLAPAYAVLYAYVLTLVAFDGIMALQPHWFSNLLGGWIFMGAFLGAHMLLALLMIYGAKHLGVADLVSPKQRHDLGKLCFGFTVFWTYLMGSVFGDLVRKPAGGDRLCLCPALGPLAADWRGGGLGNVHHSVLRTAGCQTEEGPGEPGILCHCESGGPLAGAVPAGDALGERAAGSLPRPAGAGSDLPVSRSVPAHLRLVRPELSHAFPPSGRDYAGPGAGPRSYGCRVRSRGGGRRLRS